MTHNTVKVSLIVLSGLVLLLAGGSACAQDDTGAPPAVPLNYLIDTPTAGLLERGEMGFDSRIYGDGGVLFTFQVGVFQAFNMGVSYGGTGIVGQGEVNWNRQPEVHLRYRLLNESFIWPAVNIGYSSQGYGRHYEDRYQFKARGFYGVTSKNFLLAGRSIIGFHAGINYNNNEVDDDSGPNYWFGYHHALNQDLMLVLEYDCALRDKYVLQQLADEPVMELHRRDRGYLNGALRWTFAKKLSLIFHFKDLLGNQENLENFEREIRIQYVETL
ncbi:MAG: hypothetical protein ISR91_00325 [Candidatus Delongbacteria bacterium]|nr:hypothetical protein [Candidatus Delongbacteria bacterium]